MAKEKPDIIGVARASGQFNTLLKVIHPGGRKGLLRGLGPFTVLAPTDTAWARLPEGKLEALLADKDKLGAVQEYNVVPGRLKAADIVKAKALDTALGQKVPPSQLKVATADIRTANGVIHVLDAVLLPPQNWA